MAIGRRPTPTLPRPTLVSSAARIKIGRNGTGATLPKAEGWQTEALGFRTAVPEIGYASLFVGQTLAQVRLYVGYRPEGTDPNQAPVPVDAEDSEVPPAVAEAANAELARLRSGRSTLNAFMYRYAILIDLTGEAYLVGIEATETAPESWTIRSRSEVTSDGARVTVKDTPADKGRQLVDGQDAVIRLFQSDAEWSGLAWSPMVHLLTDCRTLQVLHQQLYAEARSRLSAGIAFISNAIAPPPLSATGDDPVVDPFMDDFVDTLVAPAEDPASGASIVPMLVRCDPDQVQEGFKHHFLGRTPSPELDQKIDKRVDSLSRGLNLPVETVKGHQATTYANASQISEDEFERHLQPRMVALSEMLTIGFLHPQASGNPSIPDDWVARLEVWFDPSPIISAPDPEENADKGLEEGTLSEAAWRRHKGYDETDAPSVAERLMRLVMKRGQITQDLSNAILRLLAQTPPDEEPDLGQLHLPITVRPVTEGLDIPPIDDGDVVPTQVQDLGGEQVSASAASGGGGPPNPRGVTAAATVTPSPFGDRLVRLDRDLRTRIQTAASAALARALERAGNRVRGTAALRASCAHLPAHLRAAHVGREALHAAGLTDAQLLADAFTDLLTDIDGWTAAVQATALAELDEAARLSSATRAALVVQQADARTNALAWLTDSLTALAEHRLYDPSYGTLDVRGEQDLDGSIPVGMIRRYLTIAGRGKPSSFRADAVITHDGLDAWVAVPGEGGVAAGELLVDAYVAAGGAIESYVWEHGNPKRPFHPHLELDGVSFYEFTDPVLANTSGWPETAYYFAGDHAGCLCDWRIVTIDPPPGARVGTSDPRPPGTLRPSEVVEYRDTKSRKFAEPTMQALDALHGVTPTSAAQTEIVRGGKTERVGGSFASADRGPKPRRNRAEPYQTYAQKLAEWRATPARPRIRVNARSDGDLLSLLHEFGHRLDFDGSRMRFKSPRSDDPFLPAMSVFLRAAADTPTIKEVGRHVSGFQYIAYYRSPHEVWARAYSQWAADRLGGAHRDALDSYRREAPYYQWTDTEFTVLAPLVDGVLRAWGMLAT